MNEASSQRLDQWLWHARFFKTRSLATKFVAAGAIRVTREEKLIRVEKASFGLAPGDVLSFSRGERARIIVVEALAKRRGPASEAQSLYTDQSPPPPPKPERQPAPAAREKGAGRPTKKERRALDAFNS